MEVMITVSSGNRVSILWGRGWGREGREGRESQVREGDGAGRTGTNVEWLKTHNTVVTRDIVISERVLGIIY